MWAALVFASQIVSTFSMLGLIWFVQIVHYPLFLRAAPATFVGFETEHANRVSWIAGPLMCVELAGSLALLAASLRPPGISFRQAALGCALTGVTWASTVGLQVPLHNRLHRGFDQGTIGRLVATNWVRTVAWTLRGALLAAWVWHLVTPAAR